MNSMNGRLLKLQKYSKERKLTKTEMNEVWSLLGMNLETTELVEDRIKTIVENVELRSNETLNEIKEKFINE